MNTPTPLPLDDFYVIRAMSRYGGSFVRQLAEAARYADDNNLARIKQTWPEYWAQYTEMGRQLEQEETKP